MEETFDLTANMMKSALWYSLKSKYTGIHTEIDLPGGAGRADVIALDSLTRTVCLIEIKRTKSDFRRGKEKLHEYFDKANISYLACPPGVIPEEEVPEGWGLINFTRKIGELVVVKEPELHMIPAPFFEFYVKLILEKYRDAAFFSPVLERGYARATALGTIPNE